MVLLSVQVFILQSLWWLIPLVAASALISWLLYRRSTFSRGIKNLLRILRFSAVFITLLLLLSPFIRITSFTEDKPRLHVYFDVSKSAVKSGADSLYSEFLKNNESILGNYDIRKFYFASSVSSFNDSSIRKSATNLGEVARHLASYHSQSHPDAIVFSDGINNQGLNPVLTELQGSKLHTIAFGDTQQYPDLKAGTLRMNPTVFGGNEFTIESAVSGQNLKAGTWTAELLEDGRVVKQQTGNYPAGNLYQRLEFTMKASGKGFRRYALKIRSLGNEQNVLNNTSVAGIEVISEKRRIAVVSHAAHPDIGALKRALDKNERYELAVLSPGQLPAPASADIFITHNIPATDAESAWLKSAAESGTALFIIAGTQSRIAAISRFGAFEATNINSRSDENALPELNAGFDGFALESFWQKIFSSFPPLKVQFGRFRALPGSSVLIKQKIGQVTTDYPLQLFYRSENRKLAILLGEGIWRWRLKEMQTNEAQASVFDDWVSKTIQLISADAGRNQFQAKPVKNTFDPDEAVLINGQFIDKTGNADNKEDCQLEISGEAGLKRSYRMGKSGKFYRLDAGILPAGKYTFTTRISKYGMTSSGSFEVSAVSVEDIENKADYQLLRNWSGRNKGVSVNADQVNILIDYLKKNQPQGTIREKTMLSEWIQLKWFFLLIILLLSTEWFIRKFLGSY